MIDLSIIVPVYNEQDCVQIFTETVVKIISQITEDFEIIFIDDGSHDNTISEVQKVHAQDKRIKLISFSRNFGKEAALSAGLNHCTGKAAVPMDVDLQDPPELIVEMYHKFQEGFDNVVAIRKDRSHDTVLKRKSAQFFYRILNKMSSIDIPENAGDFRLISRKVINTLNQLGEASRFMKGLFAWPGFKTTKVYYKRPARVKGTTKFNYWKLWNFALDGIFSFSTLPLRIWTYLGVLFASLSFIYMLFTFFKTLIFGIDVPGYASLICLISFLGGLILIGIGIIGEYIARIFNEVKARPIYVIEEKLGFELR
ncbi:MAG: glycosyltransferase family 2 protein [Halobacteriovoraceae bacterium]|nr:glycosyltransferase family 2 protein [Halobacteriovoraceae bacterium]